MTDKTIANARVVGGDYFSFIYSRRSNLKLDHHLKQFNPDDYWIYKKSGIFKQVSYEDLLEFKYSGYILFKKELYNKDHINMWIDKIKKYKLTGNAITYLSRPFPPIEYLNKINVYD